MAIIDVVSWNGEPDVFAYKFPETELNTKAQLIVAESQEAILCKEGQFYGPFGPGLHVLNTKNFPFLTASVTSLLSRGVSPYIAEVWFVQKAMLLDLKWGTSMPIQLEDPRYHVMIPVRAFGQYGLQVENTKKFLTKLVGRVPYFTTDVLVSYFRGIIISYVKDCISSYLIDKGISILAIGNRMREISAYLNDRLSQEMMEFGLRSISFTVSAITTDENDSAVMQLKAALAKKAEMNILGYTYQQERSFDTMEAAAGNTGGGGNLMGAGIGLGMGMAAAAPLGNAMAGISQNLNLKRTISCPNCSAAIPEETKFCPECGASLHLKTAESQVQCPNCSATVSNGAKFCPECGTELQRSCTACGAKLKNGTKFCPECGARQE